MMFSLQTDDSRYCEPPKPEDMVKLFNSSSEEILPLRMEDKQIRVSIYVFTRKFHKKRCKIYWFFWKSFCIWRFMFDRPLFPKQTWRRSCWTAAWYRLTVRNGRNGTSGARPRSGTRNHLTISAWALKSKTKTAMCCRPVISSNRWTVPVTRIRVSIFQSVSTGKVSFSFHSTEKKKTGDKIEPKTRSRKFCKDTVSKTRHYCSESMSWRPYKAIASKSVFSPSEDKILVQTVRCTQLVYYFLNFCWLMFQKIPH